MKSAELSRHAMRDARALRDRSIPDTRRDELIAFYTEQITDIVQADESAAVWREGELPPRIVLATKLINEMFHEAHYRKDTVSNGSMADVYYAHRALYESDFPNNDAIAYTVLSALAFSVDTIRGQADPGRLPAYICAPIFPAELMATDQELALAG